MKFRHQNLLLLRADPLRPHEGKLQSDRLELKDFEIEVLTGGSFLGLRDIVRVFNQDTNAASIFPQRCDHENNELYDLRIPGSASDLR